MLDFGGFLIPTLKASLTAGQSTNREHFIVFFREKSIGVPCQSLAMQMIRMNCPALFSIILYKLSSLIFAVNKDKIKCGLL